jgi:hypothetical protein
MRIGHTTVLTILLAVFYSGIFAQEADSSKVDPFVYVTDQDAKKAVYNIVRYSGLTPNFIVIQSEDVPNAIAYIKGKKRYIKYNPDFMHRVANSSATDWAAISILAHEIGHHLLGHTIKHHESSPGDELAADKYSGFILHRMGATQEEAVEAMKLLGADEGSEKHPPKKARLDAITSGWKDSEFLYHRDAVEIDSLTTFHQTFLYKCTFNGDNNLYFVNKDNEVVWYDNYATPIVIGKISLCTHGDFVWHYHYKDRVYGIDTHGTIWNNTLYDAMFSVGTIEEIALEGTEEKKSN